MIQRLRAIAPYLVVLALSAYLFHLATRFQYTRRAGRLGPDLWPEAILTLMIIVCLGRIASILRDASRAYAGGGLLAQVTQEVHAADAPAEVPPPRQPLLLVLGVAFTIAYVALLGVLGFAIGTFLYLVAMMIVGRYRRYANVVVIAALGSLAFMFVFMKIVYLSLPIGVAPFDAVSLALMKLMHIH
ncbi:MAG TPA: tripartite tricarboxylate transporter TctB family protein [Casimicrobiaceae bacterium]